jgi:hypothetical protein
VTTRSEILKTSGQKVPWVVEPWQHGGLAHGGGVSMVGIAGSEAASSWIRDVALIARAQTMNKAVERGGWRRVLGIPQRRSCTAFG